MTKEGSEKEGMEVHIASTGRGLIIGEMREERGEGNNRGGKGAGGGDCVYISFFTGGKRAVLCIELTTCTNPQPGFLAAIRQEYMFNRENRKSVYCGS